MADLTAITKQVIDLIGANSYSGGVKQYSSTSGDEDFLDGAISRAITEAKLIAGEKVCESSSHLKSAFIQKDQAIAHNAKIPAHFGELLNVVITPYSGASPMEGQKRSSQQIASYRTNLDNVYGAFAHNEAQTTGFTSDIPATQSGFYNDDNGIMEFSGHSATISYLDFQSTPLTDYPTVLEVPITHLAVGLLQKDGTVSEKFAEHYSIGISLLQDELKRKTA